MALMGLREYARHRGCALYAVQKAIAAGRITREADGRVDSEKADAAWAARTDASQQRKAVEEPVVLMPLMDGTPQQAPSALSRRLDGPEWPPLTDWAKPSQPGVLIDGASFMAAKTLREQAEAELAQLKLAGMLGKVIDAEEARKTFRAIGRIYAAARESMPAQLAPLLVGKTDLREIERTIRTMARELDARIANEIAALDVAIAG